MTAVASHKEMLLGQRLRLEGYWIKHKKYGNQLEVGSFALQRTNSAGL